MHFLVESNFNSDVTTLDFPTLSEPRNTICRDLQCDADSLSCNKYFFSLLQESERIFGGRPERGFPANLISLQNY